MGEPMARFSILVGGHLQATPRLLYQVAGSRVVAADNGMAHAETLKLDVELWVGDFDSASPAMMARHPEVEREVHPAAKDASDSELAVDAAIRRGANDILLVGGFGGRSDHALSHVMLAVKLARQGLTAMVTSGYEEAHPLIPGRHRLDLPVGSRLSIIALSDLGALSLSGVQWPLDKRYVPFGSTLTLSNVVLGPAEVALESGNGVIVAYPG